MSEAIINVSDLLARAASRAPLKPALYFEGKGYSYAELERDVERFASALAQEGLPAGSVVGIYLESVPELLIAFLGSHRAGMVANVINGSLKGPEAHFILADSQTRLLVTDEDRWAMLSRVNEPLPDLGRVVHPGPGFEAFLESGETGPGRRHPVSEGDLCTLMYTSGTTGRPKGVMLSHRNLVNNATLFGAIHFASDDRLLIGAPLFHCWGLINGFLGIVSQGGTAIILRRFQTELALDWVERSEATQFLGVAAMYNFMLKHPRAKEALRSLRVAHSAAAPTPVELIERLRGEFGIEYAESYGLTETSPVITTAHFTQTRPGSCGKAMGDTELMVVSPDGRRLGPGEVGELWARGTAVMLGYWRRPDATAAAITPEGWFKTGDIVRMDEDGYVYIVDRLKDMINVAGEKVYPREVEEVLFTHPAVGDASVVGVPDELKGEVPKAYVVVKEGASLSEDEVVAYCRERLASFKVPRAVEFVSEIPRSASGKTLRRLLRGEHAAIVPKEGAS